MGTTGSGRITDYFDDPPSKPVGGGGGSGGEGPTEDPCNTAFTDSLEEVAISEYYTKLHQLPKAKEAVNVQYKNKRLAVLDDANGHIIGYLPTSRNYLRKCITEKSFQYTGVVASARMLTGNVPEVKVSIIP